MSQDVDNSLVQPFSQLVENHETSTLGRAEIRRLVMRVLPLDSDFDAFCADYFPLVYQHFANGMDRIAKTTMLLEITGDEEVVVRLRVANPAAFQSQLAKHKSEKMKPPLQKIANKHSSEILLGEAISYSDEKTETCRHLQRTHWLPLSPHILWPMALLALCLTAGIWLLISKIHKSMSVFSAKLELQQPRILMIPRPHGAFFIHETEVTVAQYATCVKAGLCSAVLGYIDWDNISIESLRLYSPNCTTGQPGMENHPVNCIDFEQASEYCKRVGMRLPTAEEWEYAAQGTDDRQYPWGNEPPTTERLNACDDDCTSLATRLDKRVVSKGSNVFFEPLNGTPSEQLLLGSDGYSTTAPVGSYPLGQSPFGVMDMAGNVREWTISHIERCIDGKCRIFYVLKGGSWTEVHADDVSIMWRKARSPPDNRCDMHGFRCVQPL